MPLDLEAHELVLALGQRLGRLDALLFDQCMNARSKTRITDSDEAPGLHQSDAGRHVRGGQQAPHQLLVERIGQKVPHVPPHGDYAVNGGDFLRGKITHVGRVHKIQTVNGAKGMGVSSADEPLPRPERASATRITPAWVTATTSPPALRRT